MVIPEAFKELCGYIHQDVGHDDSNPENWIEFALRHLSDEDCGVVRRFLDDLFQRSIGDRELQDIWFSSGAEIYFPDANHLRGFLSLMRDSVRVSR